MAEDRRIPEGHQNIALRMKKAADNGVHNVESFNEECIVVDTDLELLL